MATRATNEAVEVYRAVVWAQHKLDRASERLTRATLALTDDEFREYMRMTTEIDIAVEEVENHALADSTFDQYLSRAIHTHGLDRNLQG